MRHILEIGAGPAFPLGIQGHTDHVTDELSVVCKVVVDEAWAV